MISHWKNCELPPSYESLFLYALPAAPFVSIIIIIITLGTLSVTRNLSGLCVLRRNPEIDSILLLVHVASTPATCLLTLFSSHVEVPFKKAQHVRESCYTHVLLKNHHMLLYVAPRECSSPLHVLVVPTRWHGRRPPAIGKTMGPIRGPVSVVVHLHEAWAALNRELISGVVVEFERGN